jgi:hypothetical protein
MAPHLATVSYLRNETLGTAHQSSAFSPTLFSGGEGGRRPDEGACVGTVIKISDAQLAAPNAPLIRLRHLLPPQKARGEKALDGWEPQLQPSTVAPSVAPRTDVAPPARRLYRRRLAGDFCVQLP